MNKTWLIIGGAVVLLLLVWFLFGRNPAGVSTDRNIDGSTTYSNEEGSVTVGGASMPENWPADAPSNYSGASIQYSGTSNPQTGKTGSAVVYTVNASAPQVTEYYKAELAKSGWKIEGTAVIGPSTAITATKDARTLGVYIGEAGNGTVSVTVGIEM